MAKRKGKPGKGKIWYQSFVHPVEQAAYMRRLQALLDKVSASGFAFEVHGLDPPDHSFHPLSELRCATQAIRNAIEAERAGYEAFVLGHFQEPGLLELRCAVDIPVISLGEANMLAAMTMGQRFGLVTIDPGAEAAGGLPRLSGGAAGAGASCSAVAKIRLVSSTVHPHARPGSLTPWLRGRKGSRCSPQTSGGEVASSVWPLAYCADSRR